MMKLGLDELLSQLGNPGRYQVFIFLLLCLNYFPVLFNHVIMAFLGARPTHQCHSRTHMNSSVNFVSDFKDVLSLYDNNGSHAGQFESCKATDLDFGGRNASDLGGRNSSITCPGSEDSFLVYLKTEHESTIVTEWDLVCSQAYLSGLATTIYFCGVMVGGLAFGHLADKFGRKPVMLACLLMPVLIGVSTSFAVSYTMFVVLRFFQGIFIQGLQISTFTLAMELFQPKHRSYAGAILECFWGLGVMVIPLLAYLIPNWRHLVLVISLPSLLMIFYICIIPESLRWMIMRGRMEQCEAVIGRMSSVNHLAFPEVAWAKVKQQQGLATPDTHLYSFMDLLRTPKLRVRSLVLFYIWFATSIGYYGLTWLMIGLPGNKYLNFFISGTVEFVAYTLVIYVTKRFGRKRPLLIYFLLASAFMIGGGVVFVAEVNMVYLSSGLAIAGKFAMGGIFSVIFLYSSELYPTVIRNIGMGGCAFWTRVGGVIAPQLLLLGQYGNQGTPLILFGVVTMIGGFLTLLLPETLGRKLPDTIDDAENLSCHGNSSEEVNQEEMKSLRTNDENC